MKKLKMIGFLSAGFILMVLSFTLKYGHIMLGKTKISDFKLTDFNTVSETLTQSTLFLILTALFIGSAITTFLGLKRWAKYMLVAIFSIGTTIFLNYGTLSGPNSKNGYEISLRIGAYMNIAYVILTIILFIFYYKLTRRISYKK